MKAETENYKGIEFIRISKLPVNQREMITKTISPERIIKILKEKELLIDCIQSQYYSDWYDLIYNHELEPERVEKISPAKKFEAIKIAFGG